MYIKPSILKYSLKITLDFKHGLKRIHRFSTDWRDTFHVRILTCCLFRSWAATNSPISLPWMNCTLARTTWTSSRNGCSRTWPRSRNSTCSRTISVSWTAKASSGWKTFPRCFSTITCWDSSTTSCSSRWQTWKNCTYYTIILNIVTPSWKNLFQMIKISKITIFLANKNAQI